MADSSFIVGVEQMKLQISPNMIRWIADLQHIEPQALALEFAPKKEQAFLNGIVTKTVATELAKKANIPFGYLFLQTPPVKQRVDIPDLRQVVGAEPLSRDFFEVLQDIEFKQEWFKDYLLDQGNEALPFVAQFPFHHNLNPNDVVQAILNTLGIKDFMAEIQHLSRSDYFRFLAAKFEQVGILVFRNGVVNHNNKRKLNINEFRGFALVDSIAPVVFINGADYPAAQLFTLIHEVAHIWIGKSGVSSWNQEQAVESFCNKAAAEFLMPTMVFCRHWQPENIEQSIDALAALFKVSRFAVVIKAVTLKLLDQEAIAKEREKLKLSAKSEAAGGNFYNTVKIRQSARFCDTVLNLAMSRRLPFRTAGKLLNIHADTLIPLYRATRKS